MYHKLVLLCSVVVVRHTACWPLSSTDIAIYRLALPRINIAGTVAWGIPGIVNCCALWQPHLNVLTWLHSTAPAPAAILCSGPLLSSSEEPVVQNIAIHNATIPLTMTLNQVCTLPLCFYQLFSVCLTVYTLSADNVPLSLADYARLGEPQGMHIGAKKSGEQLMCNGQTQQELGLLVNTFFTIQLLTVLLVLDPHLHNSVCIGKAMSILRGPWKLYRDWVVCVLRHDAFFVELEIISWFCIIHWAHLALVW